MAKLTSTSHLRPSATSNTSLSTRVDLFLISFLLLFMEMACIRWFPSHVMLLTFLTNTMLLACFVGMSVGCLVASSTENHLDSTPARLAFALGLGVLADALAGVFQIMQSVSQEPSPQFVFFGAEYHVSAPTGFAIPVELMNGLFFLLVAVAMLGPGQELGRALNRVPDRVQAYSINIFGSLAGILAFAACSWLHLSPFWWFLILIVGLGYFLGKNTPSRRFHLYGDQIAMLAVILLLASVPWGSIKTNGKRIGEHLWSPYYRIDYYYAPLRHIAANLIGHQSMVSRTAPTGYAYELPYLLRHDSGDPGFKNVLVIGAGSGNDVSRALQWGAQHVDAVEIDPVILRLGKEFNPDAPYADARVSIHLDDGRNFLRSTRQHYDLIVYALVDSIILHSSYSDLRLENYLFTRQAFDDVRKHLEPGGLFFISNYFPEGWLVNRLDTGLTETFGAHPLILTLPYRDKVFPQTKGAFAMLLAGNTERIRAAFAMHGYYLIHDKEPAGPGSPNGFEQDPPLAQATQWKRFGLASVAGSMALKVPTDNWPYTYLPHPEIAEASLRGMAVMGVLALLLLLYPFLQKRREGGKQFVLSGRMFFLGAGFMLVETEAVVHMALLFGSTWMVNTVVFIAVLIMIAAANFYVLKFRPHRLHAYYAGLLATLGLNVVIPLDLFLGMSRSLQVVGSCLLIFTPIFFAGIVFAASFDRSEAAEIDFGTNIAGAMFGGLAEYSSTLLGFQYLMLVAVLFYILSAAMPHPFSIRLLGKKQSPASVAV